MKRVLMFTLPLLLQLLPQLLNAQKSYSRDYFLSIKGGVFWPADLEDPLDGVAHRNSAPMVSICLDKALAKVTSMRFEFNTSYFSFQNDGGLAARSYYAFHGQALFIGLSSSLAIIVKELGFYGGIRANLLPYNRITIDSFFSAVNGPKSSPELNRVSASIFSGVEFHFWNDFCPFLELSKGLFQIQKGHSDEISSSVKPFSLSSFAVGVQVPLKTIRRRGTYRIDMPL